jgi:hypothetical protein
VCKDLVSSLVKPQLQSPRTRALGGALGGCSSWQIYSQAQLVIRHRVQPHERPSRIYVVATELCPVEIQT